MRGGLLLLLLLLPLPLQSHAPTPLTTMSLTVPRNTSTNATELPPGCPASIARVAAAGVVGGGTSTSEALVAVGMVATCFSLLMWISPVRDVWTAKHGVFRSGGTDAVATALPFAASLGNCVLWIMFMLATPDRFQVPIAANAVGGVLNLSFVACFGAFATGWKRTELVVALVLDLLLFIAGGVLFAYGVIEAVGYLAVFVNVLMYAGPSVAFKRLIETKSTHGVPFPPIALEVCASSAWFAYGFLACSVQVLIPNGLGIALSVTMVGLFAWVSCSSRASPAASRENEGSAPFGTKNDVLTLA